MFRNFNHMMNTIPVLQEIDKAFINQFQKVDQTLDKQTALFMQMGIENPKIMKDAFSQYHDIMKKFSDEIGGIVANFRNGSFGTLTTKRRFKEISGKHYMDMFMAGTRAVGNEYYDKMGMDKRSKAFLNKARRAEMKFFSDFLDDMKNPDHKPRHRYSKRAQFYAQSAKAQFFNGMVAGAGSEMNVHWKLGTPQTESCDICPTYADHGAYTWETLPTVPRGGDTPCLFRCYCHLEFDPKGIRGKMKGGDPDLSWTQHGAFSAQPDPHTYKMPGQILDKNGKPVPVSSGRDEWHNDIRSSLNKARQMIAITKGKERMKWIRKRAELNQVIIDLTADQTDFKFLPTMSVKDLESTIKSAYERGGGRLTRLAGLQEDDEVYWVRGTESGAGVIGRDESGLFVRLADGSIRRLFEDSDINFLVGGPSFQFGMKAEALNRPGIPIMQVNEINAMDLEIDDALLFQSPEGQRLRDMLESHMGIPITDEWIQNELAKMRSLAFAEVSSKIENTYTDLFGNKSWTDDRKQMHNMIMEKFMAQGVDGDHLVVVGGPPGSNKLYNVARAGFNENNYVVIDIDLLKLELAEFDGNYEVGHRTYKYEEEARELYKRLYDEAMVAGKNVVLSGDWQTDVTFLDNYILQADNLGYKTDAYYMELPYDVAQQRAFVGAFMGTDKQFFDPYQVFQHSPQAGNDRDWFADNWGENVYLDKWWVYDANVLPGDIPPIFDSHHLYAQRNAPAPPAPPAPQLDLFGNPIYTSQQVADYVSKIYGLDVISCEPMSHQGVSKSYKVGFPNGEFFVYKPGAGEMHGVRSGITDSYTREAMAFQVDRQLQWNIVPETVVRDVPIPDIDANAFPHATQIRGKGSFQHMVDGVEGQYADNSLIPIEEKQKLLLLDYVIQNTDRHGGNWYWDDNISKVWAIDNGLGFPAEGDAYNLTFSGELEGTPIPDYLIESLKNLRDSKAQLYEEILKSFSHIGLTEIPDEEKEALERMFIRIDNLISNPFYSDDAYDFFDIS